MPNQQSEPKRNGIFLLLIVITIPLLLLFLGNLEVGEIPNKNKKLQVEENKIVTKNSNADAREENTLMTGNLFSRGEEILITAGINLNKTRAANAFALELVSKEILSRAWVSKC